MASLPYHYDWKLAYEIDLGLRVHWFGRYAGYSDWDVPTSRLAADMVFFFFVEKASCWAVVNGCKFLLQTGDVLVVTGGDEFCFGHDPSRPHVSLSGCLAMQRGSLPNVLLQRKFPRRFTWSNPEEYSREFEKVMSAFASDSQYRDIEIAAALLRWLAYVLSRMAAPLDATFTDNRTAVDKVLAAETWAISRLNQPISLDEWAKAVSLHPVYFGQIFKRETGFRPMEWLTQRRLQMASQLLSSTRKTVAEVGESCGFADQFYFSRVFRNHFGQSPMRYRKSALH